MKKVLKEKLKRDRKRIESSFFNKFKKCHKHTTVGNLEKDFILSMDLLFQDHSVFFSSEEYKERYVSKKWNEWSKRIYQSLKELLINEKIKRFYNLNNSVINEHLIKTYYLKYLKRITTFETEEDEKETKEIKESDISNEELKDFWITYYKFLISFIGIEDEIRKDIVLENLQKKWF